MFTLFSSHHSQTVKTHLNPKFELFSTRFLEVEMQKEIRAKDMAEVTIRGYTSLSVLLKLKMPPVVDMSAKRWQNALFLKAELNKCPSFDAANKNTK